MKKALFSKSNHCIIIAEVAQSHEGSLGMAHAFIDSIADSGADAVKFQTHIASEESTLDEPWRVKFSTQDQSRYDYWKRMEFTEAQWFELAEHAKKRGLLFLSSPFSVRAVDLLKRIGVSVWKVASGEIRNIELLEAIWQTRQPILFSSGLSNLDDIASVIEETRKRNIEYGLFQCTSEYPCPPKHWGLNLIDDFRNKYKCPIGFSDHSGTIYAGLAAVALRVDFLEVHVTFDRKMFGPDVPSSLTFQDLVQLVQGVRQIAASIESPVRKDQLAQDLLPVRKIFERSWALKSNLPAGTIIERHHLTLKKPGTGISYSQVEMLLGKKLCAETASNRLLKPEDVE